MVAVGLRPLSRAAGARRRLLAGQAARTRLAGVALIALAFAFATSTAIFNAHLFGPGARRRASSPTAPMSPSRPRRSAMPPPTRRAQGGAGVVAAEPMQHRLAYVGTDLQDLYGIDPARIGRATPLSDAYFGNGNAEATLALLTATPDGVLVSAGDRERFPAEPGRHDQSAHSERGDHQYHVVPFKFIGIVREFPTAPHDSFLVANASYVAQASHSPAAETVLIKDLSCRPANLAVAVRNLLAATPASR